MTATGRIVVKSVEISRDAVDLDDLDLLQDLIVAAVNEALKEAKDMAERRMTAITGNMMRTVG